MIWLLPTFCLHAQNAVNPNHPSIHIKKTTHLLEVDVTLCLTLRQDDRCVLWLVLKASGRVQSKSCVHERQGKHCCWLDGCCCQGWRISGVCHWGRSTHARRQCMCLSLLLLFVAIFSPPAPRCMHAWLLWRYDVMRSILGVFTLVTMTIHLSISCLVSAARLWHMFLSVTCWLLMWDLA